VCDCVYVGAYWCVSMCVLVFSCVFMHLLQFIGV